MTPAGLTMVSTFSGCGGACEGFKRAGFRVLWANDRDMHAVETYQKNHPGTTVDPRDIRDITSADILTATGLIKGELDVFEGSPPCPPFSMMGRREKAWGTGDKDEERFFDWITILDGLQPRAFVAENVAALAYGRAWWYLRQILERMRACGYRVEARTLDAQWLGVPQMRKRIIFVGMRQDLGLAPQFPVPLPHRHGVADVLPRIAAIEGCEYGRSIWRPATEPIGTIMKSARPIKARLTDGTLRKLTFEEIKALCGFPPDFVIEGSYTQQHARLGNAVPPPMAYAIACTLRDALLSERREAA